MRPAPAFVLLSCGLLSACVNVLPEAGPAPQIYRLDGEDRLSPEAVSEQTTRGGLTVVVPEPLAQRALATDRVAVIADGGHISYASGARWTERASLVVQDRILAAFEDDARVSAALRPEDGVPAAYEVRLELRSFEAVYRDGDKAAPTSLVVLRAKLVDRRSRELIAATRIETEARAGENRMGAIVDAFDMAMDEAGRRVVAWTVAQASARE